MKNMPNLIAIRQRLPHGGLRQIASKTGLTPEQISKFFSHGWYPEHSEIILSAAAEILQGGSPSAEVLDDLADLGLVGGGGFVRPRARRAVQRQRSVNPPFVLYVGVILALLFFLVPAFKTLVLNMWSRVTSGALQND